MRRPDIRLWSAEDETAAWHASGMIGTWHPLCKGCGSRADVVAEFRLGALEKSRVCRACLLAALSAACVAYGRELAGLPPLPAAPPAAASTFPPQDS